MFRGDVVVFRVNFAALVLALFTVVVGAPAHAAYMFYVDNFSVDKNGAPLFNDSFSDGLPPPNAPNFLTNGVSASYSVYGTVGPETGGKLVLDSTGAVPSTGPVPNLVQNIILNTNTSDLPADASLGLKSNMTFSVSGLFDFVQPGPVGEGYGIRLTDYTPSHTGNDIIDLLLTRGGNSALNFQLRQVDLTLGTITILEEIAADPLHQQFLLSLSKTDAGSSAIHAAFAYVDSGMTGNATSFSSTPTIFNGESYTSAGIHTLTPVPLPAAGGLLLSGLVAVFGSACRRRR